MKVKFIITKVESVSEDIIIKVGEYYPKEIVHLYKKDFRSEEFPEGDWDNMEIPYTIEVDSLDISSLNNVSVTGAEAHVANVSETDKQSLSEFNRNKIKLSNIDDQDYIYDNLFDYGPNNQIIDVYSDNKIGTKEQLESMYDKFFKIDYTGTNYINNSNYDKQSYMALYEKNGQHFKLYTSNNYSINSNTFYKSTLNFSNINVDSAIEDVINKAQDDKNINIDDYFCVSVKGYMNRIINKNVNIKNFLYNSNTNDYMNQNQINITIDRDDSINNATSINNFGSNTSIFNVVSMTPSYFKTNPFFSSRINFGYTNPSENFYIQSALDVCLGYYSSTILVFNYSSGFYKKNFLFFTKKIKELNIKDMSYYYDSVLMPGCNSSIINNIDFDNLISDSAEDCSFIFQGSGPYYYTSSTNYESIYDTFYVSDKMSNPERFKEFCNYENLFKNAKNLQGAFRYNYVLVDNDIIPKSLNAKSAESLNHALSSSYVIIDNYNNSVDQKFYISLDELSDKINDFRGLFQNTQFLYHKSGGLSTINTSTIYIKDFTLDFSNKNILIDSYIYPNTLTFKKHNGIINLKNFEGIRSIYENIEYNKSIDELSEPEYINKLYYTNNNYFTQYIKNYVYKDSIFVDGDGLIDACIENGLKTDVFTKIKNFNFKTNGSNGYLYITDLSQEVYTNPLKSTTCYSCKAYPLSLLFHTEKLRNIFIDIKEDDFFANSFINNSSISYGYKLIKSNPVYIFSQINLSNDKFKIFHPYKIPSESFITSTGYGPYWVDGYIPILTALYTKETIITRSNGISYNMGSTIESSFLDDNSTFHPIINNNVIINKDTGENKINTLLSNGYRYTSSFNLIINPEHPSQTKKIKKIIKIESLLKNLSSNTNEQNIEVAQVTFLSSYSSQYFYNYALDPRTIDNTNFGSAISNNSTAIVSCRSYIDGSYNTGHIINWSGIKPSTIDYVINEDNSISVSVDCYDIFDNSQSVFTDIIYVSYVAELDGYEFHGVAPMYVNLLVEFNLNEEVQINIEYITDDGEKVNKEIESDSTESSDE